MTIIIYDIVRFAIRRFNHETYVPSNRGEPNALPLPSPGGSKRTSSSELDLQWRPGTRGKYDGLMGLNQHSSSLKWKAIGTLHPRSCGQRATHTPAKSINDHAQKYNQRTLNINAEDIYLKTTVDFIFPSLSALSVLHVRRWFLQDRFACSS